MTDLNLTDEELNFFRSINTPKRIQDYLDSLAYNFCGDEDYICKSPRMVLREGNAHCLEGALFAAAAMRVNGHKPLLIELAGLYEDYHFLAPFKSGSLWGAMSQSKYYTLTWRDPIYKTVRELVLSYFPVYINDDEITLRRYTNPVDLSDFDDLNWMAAENSLDEVGDRFGNYRHIPLFPKRVELRNTPPILDDLMRRHVNKDSIRFS